MKKYVLSSKDMYSNYFHFTRAANLESIEINGLIPQKGKHAEYTEETKKVFFVKGLDNLLILFDCWLNVYKKMPIVPNIRITYGLGSKLMRSKYFPMFFVDIYFMLVRNSKRHRNYAYKVFSKQISECILLNLDIREDEDFSYSDIDEIKSRGYRKRHLIELGYSEKYSDMNSNKMDEWNLHTKSDKVIEPDKIKLCRIEDSYKIEDIIDYAIKHTNLDLKEICPVLYDYMNNYKNCH